MKRKIYAILLSVIICLLYLFIYKSIPSFHLKNDFAEYIIRYSIMSVLLIIALIVLHRLSILKFEWKKFKKGLWLGLLFIVLALARFIPSLISQSAENEFLPVIDIVIFIVAILIGTGFTEEVLCRGIVMNLLLDNYGRDTRKGITTAILLSSFIFGFSHLSNAISSDVNLAGALLQSIAASGMGLFFGAVYARSHSIWPVVFLHGFWDISGMVAIGFFGVGKVLDLSYSLKNEEDIIVFLGALTAAIVIFFLYYAYYRFILRKKKFQECLES